MAKTQLTYVYHDHSKKTVLAVTAKSRQYADKEANGATFQNVAYGAIEAHKTAKEMGWLFNHIQLF